MALKQLLLLGLIIVDHSCVSSRVEDLCPVLSGQVMYSLSNVLIESHDPLQIQSVKVLFSLIILLVVLLVIALSRFVLTIHSLRVGHLRML